MSDAHVEEVAPERNAPTPMAGPAARASAEDRALVQRLLGGDEAAFTELVERYHGAMVRLAGSFVSDRGAAEEVAQDAWLGVLKGLPSFEGRSSLKTWMFRILTNRARSRGARDARMVTFSALGLPDGADEPAVDPARFTPKGMWARPPRRWDNDTPEKLAVREETKRRLEEALSALPASQRAVVTLRQIEGLDAAEVCNVLDISETNQRVLLHRARSRLRRALEEHLEQ